MPDKKQSIILGSLVTAVLSTSYLGLINMCCCAGLFVGALATVWHYTETNSLTVPGGTGAVMGLIACTIGALIALVLDYALMSMGIRADHVIMQFILDNLGDQMPPESYDQIVEQMEQELTVPSYLMNQIWALPVSAIIGAAGGAIGAAIFKKGPAPATV